MAQNVNPTPSASSGFDKDAAERGSATSSAQVSAIYFISFGLLCSLSSDFLTFFQYFAKFCVWNDWKFYEIKKRRTPSFLWWKNKIISTVFFGYEILARLKKFREIKNRANFFKETPPNCSAPNNRKTKFQ